MDGIDIDYEHFKADPDTFAECIGQLISTLKRNKEISFASIAPFDDDQVQKPYLALWNKYGNQINMIREPHPKLQIQGWQGVGELY